MPDQPKISFQLTARDAKRLEVRVTAPGGETRGETDLPDASLLDELTTASASTGKLPGALTEKAGKVLYSTLINESVDELVIDTLNDAIRENTPLLFELRFDPDQIALTQYPWELIQNAQGQFLVRDGLVDLTRYITYPQPPPSFDNSIKGLPLFRVISSPSQLPPLSSGNLAITPIDTLDNATFDGLLRRLLIDRLKLWGLHFDGHGALALQCAACDTLNGPADSACWSCKKSLADAKKVGALAFEKDGNVAWIPAGEFGSVLYNAQARLALLLACETAKVGNQIVFSGLAPGLLLAGVPAVIGMQYPILDTFAGSFANEFYGALLKENDILTAMRVARRMNMLESWYSPALYLRRQPSQAEVARQAVYLTRNIDTAAPAKVSAGATFLTRLWIRRPETKPLSAAKLRAELDIPQYVAVKQVKGEAEVKFEPVEGRKLRRGEVDVTLSAPFWEIVGEDNITLFVDETLDAPPAIFAVKVTSEDRGPLKFSVMQDGGLIYTITHWVDSRGSDKLPFASIGAGAKDLAVNEHSEAVNVDDDKKRLGAAGAVGAGAAAGGEIPKMESPAEAKPDMAPPPQAQPMPAAPAPAPVTSSPPPPPPDEPLGFGGVPEELYLDDAPAAPAEEETQAGDKTEQWSPSDETQVGRRRSEEDTKIPGAPLAGAPPARSPEVDAPTRVGSSARDFDDRQQGQQQEWQSPPPEKPLVAPVQSPARSAPLPRKSGFPLAPILIIGAVGMAAIVIGAIIVIGGLLSGGDPTPPPPPPVDSEPPSIPQIVSPNGHMLHCGEAVTFEWMEVTDPSGIASYEVEVELQVRDQWQMESSQHYAKPGVNLLLDCPFSDNLYRWRVRAIDGAGNVSDFSPEGGFLMTTPVTPEPGTATATPVVLTAPAFELAEITNMAKDGYDWGGACGDAVETIIDLQAILYDPDGYDDVHVEVHYALFDPDHQQVGPEIALEMLSQGGGYYFANIDVQRAARSVKYSAYVGGEIQIYLMAFDSTGTQVFYPSEFGDRMVAPIYYCIG